MTDHAKLSASGSHRWLECPGSIKAEEPYPRGTSAAAEEGSAAHHLAELCLREGQNADHWYQHTFDEFPDYPVTMEMVEHVQAYIDFVRSFKGELLIEERVNFSEWVPGGFGTADAIVVNEGVAHIIDLKYGRGHRVDALQNPQLKLYGLGVLYEYELIHDIDLLEFHIFQPRLDNHSTWSEKASDLLFWANEICKPAAEEALGEDPERIPSIEACQWCAARGDCPSLAQFTLETVCEDFENIDVDAPLKLKDVDKLGVQEKNFIEKNADLITGFLKANTASIDSDIRDGAQGYDFKIVEASGRKSREWKDEAKAKRAIRDEIKKNGGDPNEHEIEVRKLNSVAQIEKIIGKNSKVLERHVETIAGKSTEKLVPVTDKREALTFNIDDDFKDIEPANDSNFKESAA